VSSRGLVVTIRRTLRPTPGKGSHCIPTPDEGAPAQLVQLGRTGRPPASGRAADQAERPYPSLRSGRPARLKG
jgi:hypothetical protein